MKNATTLAMWQEQPIIRRTARLFVGDHGKEEDIEGDQSRVGTVILKECKIKFDSSCTEQGELEEAYA